MKKTNSLLAITLSIIFTLLITGCSKTQPSQDIKKANSVTLTVSAAASLKDSMEEIKKIYASEKPNVSITYNFGASGSLQQQIEQGAPADIFISAATKQMKALQEKGLIINETKKDLLENKVVLITSKDKSDIKDFTDLANEKVKKVALGEPKSVPVGQYSQEVLTKLNILEKVQSKAVFAKDVKEVLTWVETGNVDAGIVYETDAKVSQKVNIVAPAPDNSHSPIIYPAAAIKASKNVDEAKEFINFLSSDKAKEAFEKYGFHVIKK
ncbi:molybdate ABC transporter substrate-binding protein [Clostridium polyendosporum]|uniref:Molybdate ABC transporter substrate-binding protein n=1 Tax=Clostridium polyendosporum TaxID=69208 RepID=A0A919RXX7_9CLOT|nr:molybdate ABC transporter substrate-binding protein [Clostridium polyendosporum]GIM27776.1 molybdate ABC transporter substrate-binding protein [Clostridium polyendosporum]